MFLLNASSLRSRLRFLGWGWCSLFREVIVDWHLEWQVTQFMLGLNGSPNLRNIVVMHHLSCGGYWARLKSCTEHWDVQVVEIERLGGFSWNIKLFCWTLIRVHSICCRERLLPLEVHCSCLFAYFFISLPWFWCSQHAISCRRLRDHRDCFMRRSYFISHLTCSLFGAQSEIANQIEIVLLPWPTIFTFSILWPRDLRWFSWKRLVWF